MASPQTDKGFVMIATDLHIAIAAARLGEAESLVLGVALHQLYGPKKLAVATLSAAEIAKGAGLNRSNVIRARRSLVARNILEETEGGYRFVKDYETWTFNGRPLLTPTMVGYAATFVPDIRPRKGKGVSQKTPEGVAEDTLGVSQKTPEGVAEDTLGCRRRHPSAPALYRNADLKTPEDLRRPRRDLRREDDDDGACACGTEPDRKPEASAPVPAAPSDQPVGVKASVDLADWLTRAYPKHAGDLAVAVGGLAATYPPDWIQEAVAAACSRSRVRDKAAYVDVALRARKADPAGHVPARPKARADEPKPKPAPKPVEYVAESPQLAAARPKWLEKIRERNRKGAKS